MHRIVRFGSSLIALAARIAAALDWLPPTLTRIVVGTVFFQSGWGKLHSLPTSPSSSPSSACRCRPFRRARVDRRIHLRRLAVAGLATRFAVVPLIITMIVAIRTALWDQVESVSSLFTLSEFLYIALLVWLGVAVPVRCRSTRCRPPGAAVAAPAVLVERARADLRRRASGVQSAGAHQPPGRAPVGSPFSNVTSPATIVAR